VPRIINGIKEEAVEHLREGDLAWKDRRGTAWVDLQPLLDRIFLPLERILTEAALAHSPRSVLDVGCGTGATTLAMAKRLAPLGSCTGIDISEPMLNHARRRAATDGADNAQFLAGDAQRFSFATGSFDAIVSRFGVMFFDVPEAALANIGRAISPGGTLTCLVWRSREENDFMTAAERAVGPLLGWSDQPDPDAPGQFAWADPERINQILKASGWRSVEIVPVDIPCTMARTDLRRYEHRMGRIGIVLPALDSASHDSVSAALDAAFAKFVTDDTAQFQAACWMISARSATQRL